MMRTEGRSLEERCWREERDLEEYARTVGEEIRKREYHLAEIRRVGEIWKTRRRRFFHIWSIEDWNDWGDHEEEKERGSENKGWPGEVKRRKMEI